MAAAAQLSLRDIHPLLRHPRPITGDSAKAQRMLGLISDTEDKETGLRREKSKTTKWLERPMYAHLDISDAESEKDDFHDQSKISEPSDDEKDGDLLPDRTVKADRPTSFSSEDATQATAEPKTKLDASFNKRRPEPLKNLRPISYDSQHLLNPEWTASPATMSPDTQRLRPISLQHGNSTQQRSSVSSTSSTGSDPRFVHPYSWPAPMPQHHPCGRLERPASYQPPSSNSDQGHSWSLGSPQLTERRPRPTSFATYQHRDRRGSKIASSRGLRNNSYPNFSRPISDAPPKTVPGESIESDALYSRVTDIEVGLPLPPSLARSTSDGCDSIEENTRVEKKSKHRWSTIPASLMKFTIRRSSGSANDQKQDTNDLHRVSLVEDTARHPTRHHHASATPGHMHSGGAPLPTPTYSPLDFNHPFPDATLPPPFAPWAEAPPSPALSHETRRGSEVSLSPTRKRTSSRLSVENISLSRPTSMHSRNSSFGMPSPRNLAPPIHTPTHALVHSRPGSSRRGTPSLERTCIVCKTTQEPTAFINRRIAANCWHEPATCYGCLQAHIERSVIAQGWEHCTCPECGERLTYEDMGAFADDDTFVRWDD